MKVELTFGAGALARTVTGCDERLAAYRQDPGYAYMRYQPTTPPDVLVPEDLAVTALVNSRFDGRAFRSIHAYGGGLDLRRLPSVPLADTSEHQREEVASLIAQAATWSGFGASLATKTLHKKR